MAPLSLKVIQDDGTATRCRRTVKLDSKSNVNDALNIIKEKFLTPEDGKEYGLFLTSADNDLSGVWLEGHRCLDYYMLRDGDQLYYLCKKRNLRVRMLDGAVKTMQVDESKPVEELMIGICGKIGITNHDEYGLCHDEEDMDDGNTAGNMGTLTLKRVREQKDRDAKLDQLSKKLKTDDNVQWLDQHKTLREMAVGPKQTLLLKRRLFYSDRNVDARDPVQLNLLYVQARDAILDGRHPVTEEKAAVCKLRWINIRDVYRRILRKKLQNPGSRIRMYKYEAELGFMRPFYRDVSIQLEIDENDKSEHLWEDEVFEDVDNVNIQNDSDESQASVKAEKKAKVSKRKKKKKIQKEDDKPAPPSLEESTAADFDPADPVDAFLLSIGATLKTFSPYHLNLAKTKIFAVVQEHDLEQIVQNTNDVKTSESLYIMS